MNIVFSNMKGGTGKSTLALAFASLLGDENCDLISVDPQDTLGKASELTGRFEPIPADKASKRFRLWDTPPYLTRDLNYIYQQADLVIIPCKIGYPDLLALKSTQSQLSKIDRQTKQLLFSMKPDCP